MADHQDEVRAILAAFACGKASCRCARAVAQGKGNTHCPVHDDPDPSLNVEGKNGRTLLYCHGGCTQDAVIIALTARGLFGQNGRRRETVYAVKDASGAIVAEHVRIDEPDVGKRMSWRRPGGAPGVGGMSTKALPRLGVEHLQMVDPTIPAILCEGEKTTNALRARGLAAVGTVTGAKVTPSDDVLRALAGRPVVL